MTFGACGSDFVRLIGMPGGRPLPSICVHVVPKFVVFHRCPAPAAGATDATHTGLCVASDGSKRMSLTLSWPLGSAVGSSPCLPLATCVHDVPPFDERNTRPPEPTAPTNCALSHATPTLRIAPVVVTVPI